MPTKYPIMLVHGIIFRESRVFHSFGKIEKNLKAQGYCVYVGKQDGFGTIENNAAQLKEQIDKILAEEQAEKINLIAHSKGGLDCKYLIDKLGMEDKVASLTTLCTPHMGSPVASKIMRFPKWMLKFVAFWINLWYRIFGDRHPDSYRVCEQLKARGETEPFPYTDRIYCQSFSATMERVRDDFVMGIPLIFSRMIRSGETDGLVPVESAKFGNYRGACVEGSVSHSQIVGFMTRKKKRERINGFYSTLCGELAEMGF